MTKELREMLLFEGMSFPLGTGAIKKSVAVVLAAKPTSQMLCEMARELMSEVHDEKDHIKQNRLHHARFMCQFVMSYQLADHLGLIRTHRSFDIATLVPRSRWRTSFGENMPMPEFHSIAFDHPVHFRASTRPWRPAACVVNNYDIAEDEMSKLLSETPLCTQPLDFPNIYYPGGTHQILIVPR